MLDAWGSNDADGRGAGQPPHLLPDVHRKGRPDPPGGQSATNAGPVGAPAPPNEQTLPDPNAPSFFTAIQEQLGLKLESTKAPLPVLVLDKIEHLTGN